MVRYTSTFGIKPGSDKDKVWVMWQEIHVPRAIQLLKGLITKYTILRVENADPGGKPELFGGIELWFKDWECARKGVSRMLGQNPDALDEASKLAVDLRRAFVIEEKVVYEES
jgi:hypothetical protein